MNTNQRVRLLSASFVALATLAACAEDEAFRSVEDQIELAVDTVEGQFPGYSVDREALALAIEAAGQETDPSFAPPPVGPCPPPPTRLDVDRGAEGEAAQRGPSFDHGGPVVVDPVLPGTLENGQGMTEIPQLGLDEREDQGRDDDGYTVVDPLNPISLAPLTSEPSPSGLQRLIIASEGEGEVEAPELDACLDLCVSDYAGCAGTESDQLLCADEISACVEQC